MTQPTPDDARVWTYHLLGWATRRIAAEVDSSQSTVTRIIQRIKDDPDHPVHTTDPEKTAAFAAMVTPPNGFRLAAPTAPQPRLEEPVTQPDPPKAAPPPMPAGQVARDNPPRPAPAPARRDPAWPVMFAVVAMIIAVAALCFAGVAWKTAHNIAPVPGPAGHAGPPGQPGVNRVRICVRFDNVTGDISSIYGTKTDCGANRLLIKVP